MNFFKQRHYLDYASSTPLDTVMLLTFPVLPTAALEANPSALHKEGQSAKQALQAARLLVAETITAHQDEIIFTANATESDNIAVHGSVKALLQRGVAPQSIAVITNDSEHAAIYETINALPTDIVKITLSTTNGLLDPKDIVVPEGVTNVIISVMYVNNEIGVVQPIHEIVKRVRFLKKQHPAVSIVFHTDATQAPLHFALNVQKLGIDMMTLGATKLYCPKGVGMLYIKRDTAIAPIVYGGGQEYGLRPGTEPVQLIHTFAHSLAYAQHHEAHHSEKISALQIYFETLIKTEISMVVITAESSLRTPHITHIAIPHFDSELLVLEMDARGFAISSKSACKNEDVNESDLVTRIYGQGWGAIRISYGRMTTKKQLRKAVAALVSIIDKYKK